MAVAGQVEHPERLKTQEVSFTSEVTKVPDCFARIELGTDETRFASLRHSCEAGPP
jgi:hypothetical protein